MRKEKNRYRKLIGVALLVFSLSCKDDKTDDPIPVVPFADFVANLTAPEYLTLTANGGFKEINSIGVRGVIVYRSSATSYLAYERNCSYHPNDACATVNVHSSNLYMIDPCCNSSFNFSNGSPSGGVAWRALRQYQTELVGTSLTISSTIAN